jgi:hypothetical protein
MSSSSDVVVAVAATVVAVRVVTVVGDVSAFSFSEVVEEAEVTALAVTLVTFGEAGCFWVDDEMSVLFGCDDAVDDVLVRLVWLPLRGMV